MLRELRRIPGRCPAPSHLSGSLHLPSPCAAGARGTVPAQGPHHCFGPLQTTRPLLPRSSSAQWGRGSLAASPDYRPLLTGLHKRPPAWASVLQTESKSTGLEADRPPSPPDIWNLTWRTAYRHALCPPLGAANREVSWGN